MRATSIAGAFVICVGFAPVIARAGRAGDCARRFLRATGLSPDRTRLIPSRPNRPSFRADEIFTADAEDLRRPFMVLHALDLLGPEAPYGPMHVLAPEDFDHERRAMIFALLREARSPARIDRALPAAVKYIRDQRAEGLRTFRAADAATKSLLASVVAHWRDRTTIEPEARRKFDGGIEVGVWVLTLKNGRVLISPMFSDVHEWAYCSIRDARERLRDFLFRVRWTTGNPIRSAALFHNHPNGRVALSVPDFLSTDQNARVFGFIPEFHVYALAERDGRVEIGHYGVRSSTIAGAAMIDAESK